MVTEFRERHELMSSNKLPEDAPVYADGSQAEWFIYWLLRCYQSGHREGWEKGPSVEETMNDLHSVLCNEGYDPAKPGAAALLKKRMPLSYEPPSAIRGKSK
jgi:hypothetical protein